MRVRARIILSYDKSREGEEIEIHWDQAREDLSRWTIDAERLDRNEELDYDIDDD